MKIQFVFTLCVITVLLCGCSSSMKFTEFHSSRPILGQVGKPKKVDGVDFWADGIPDRKFQILGVIKSSKQRLPFGHLTQAFSSSDNKDDRDSAIAKVARKNGGDGVIFVQSAAEQADYDDDFGNGKKRRGSLIVVIKYLEAKPGGP